MLLRSSPPKSTLKPTPEKLVGSHRRHNRSCHISLYSSEIESVFFTHQFWHHGTNIATPASLEGAPNCTLLGDQLCQWSSVGATADSLLLASHLTVHLPPRIGAYVLANHKTNASLVTDPEVAGQNSRCSQFRSPITVWALTWPSQLPEHPPPQMFPPLGFVFGLS